MCIGYVSRIKSHHLRSFFLKPNITSVVHLIPYDAIGGVESAARTFSSGLYGDVFFQKAFLAHRTRVMACNFLADDYVGPFFSENNPLNYLSLLVKLQKKPPAVLVASLWRCYIVLVLHKLLNWQSNCVCYLHLPDSVHFVDAFFARLSMSLSHQIWTDSQATLSERVPPRWHKKAVVVPMLPIHQKSIASPYPKCQFVFWGRISSQKNLAFALKIVAKMLTYIPDTKFLIIGPDAGDMNLLRSLIFNLKLDSVVCFCGPKSTEEIAQIAKNSSFYLQTSRSEGMALSVIEAMQLGLVPVVAPVGEIGSYCSDGWNSLFVSSPDDTVLRILKLVQTPSRYQEIQNNAISTWENIPSYKDSFLANARLLLP